MPTFATDDESLGRRLALFNELLTCLSDNLIESDVADVMDRLVAISLELLSAHGVGLALRSRDSLAIAAVSNETVGEVLSLAIATKQGPCVDAVRTGEPVTAFDLLAEPRWPMFAASAREAGYCSVLSVPLRVREQVIGSLSVFRDTPSPVPAYDQMVAETIAQTAAIGIMSNRHHLDQIEVNAQLTRALDSRVVIEQAKGVLAERRRLGMDQAFAAIRKYARDHNQKITEVAQRVIAGEATTL